MLLLQVENERATRLRRSRLRLNSLPAFLPAEGQRLCCSRLGCTDGDLSAGPEVSTHILFSPWESYPGPAPSGGTTSHPTWLPRAVQQHLLARGRWRSAWPTVPPMVGYVQEMGPRDWPADEFSGELASLFSCLLQSHLLDIYIRQ